MASGSLAEHMKNSYDQLVKQIKNENSIAFEKQKKKFDAEKKNIVRKWEVKY